MSDEFALLPVKSDFVFKMIFGDQRNVDILGEFLKAILDIPHDEYERITVVDPHIKKETKDDKYGILDVKVHTRSGIVVQVEIQVEPIPDMDKRIIYDQAKMITEQMKSGNNWGVINQAVTIVITDYEFVIGSEKYHHKFRWRDENGLEFTNIQEINTLELNKLPPTSLNDSDLWYWTKFIKSDDKEALEMIAERNPQMRKAVGVLKELSADERTRMLFEEREKARRDMASRMDGAERKGIETVARNSMAVGLDIETIIKITGLTSGEIEALR